MSRATNLVNIKLIRGILITVAIGDQRGVTRTIGQARKPSAHGNTRYRKLENAVVISRNEVHLRYAISDYRRANPSNKERPQAPGLEKS